MAETNEQTEYQERDKALEEMARRVGVRAERGRRFAELTSLRVGGAIDWVVAPETEAQAAAIVNEMDKAGIGWRALGSGSNILADDGDHHYVVLSLKELKGELEFDGEYVSVPAGYSLPRLCIDVGR
ncbi:MAG TPA: FAD-binding protein, partial [Pyrinomonadaceae bacterium]|nr:FAD-binding protein [Pyrinomonadaceae bacterium]